MFFEDDENLNISINNESNNKNNNTNYFDFGNGEQESIENINQNTIQVESNSPVVEQNNQEEKPNNE